MRKRPMTQVDLFLAYQEGYARVKWEVISTAAEPQAAPYTCMVQALIWCADLRGLSKGGVAAMPICRVYV